MSLNNLTVRDRLAIGFSLVTIILAASILITMNRVKELDRTTRVIVGVQQPAARVLNGVNESLAALRGYMILNNQAMKAQRGRVWVEDLNPAFVSLEEFAAAGLSVQQQDLIGKMRDLGARLQKAQEEIEGISHTVNNEPALKILLEEAAPRAKIIVSSITTMIDIEAKQAATAERKALLGMMADVRGTMGLGLANIRAFLLTGDQKFADDFTGFWAKNETRFSDLQGQEKLLTPKQRTAWNNLKAARIKFAPLPPRMFEIRGSKEWNVANYWLGLKAAPVAKELVALTNDLLTFAGKEVPRAQALVTALIRLQWGLLGLGLVCSAVTAALTVRTLNTQLTRTLSAVAAASEQIAMAAQQMAGGSQGLAEGSSEQAGSIEESAATLEEITQMTAQNADNAQAARSHGGNAQTAAADGRGAMEEMNTRLGEINKSAEEMSKIIKVIEEIAFQTNLLALNAAVEAARAGEHGKGFAVVAEEVRNLAQRCAEAARNTSDLIQTSVSAAQFGREGGEKVQEVLKNIEEAVVQTASAVEEIAQASQEQVTGLGQVSEGVKQVESVSQTNAALAEEMAASSEELSAQSQSLMEPVEALRRLVGMSSSNGKMTVHTPHPAATAAAPQNQAQQWQQQPRQPQSRTATRALPQPAAAPASAEVIPLESETFDDF